MNINHIIAWLAFVLIITAGVSYARKIIKKEIEPTLSTWLIFLVGTSMSFATYLISSKKDFAAGALNGADIFSDIIVVLTTIFFGVTRWKLKSFEKYYLAGLVIIGIFWIFTSDAFHANLLIQIVLALGYFPTAHNLIKFKRNTEPLAIWSLIELASLISIYPALTAWQTNHNILGLIYSVRSVVLIGLVMALMLFYSNKNKSQPTKTNLAIG